MWAGLDTGNAPAVTLPARQQIGGVLKAVDADRCHRLGEQESADARTDDRDTPELQPLEGMDGADLDGVRLRGRVAPQASRGNAGLPEPLHRRVGVPREYADAVDVHGPTTTWLGTRPAGGSAPGPPAARGERRAVLFRAAEWLVSAAQGRCGRPAPVVSRSVTGKSPGRYR